MGSRGKSRGGGNGPGRPRGRRTAPPPAEPAGDHAPAPGHGRRRAARPEPEASPARGRQEGRWRTGGRAQARKAAKRARNRRRVRATREVPILVVVALLIALLLKTFLVQAFSIPSGSMENTIRVGDRVVVDKLTPWFGSEPHRGDVVVFKDPGGWLPPGRPHRQDPPVIKQVKEFFTFIGLLPSADEQDLIKRVVGLGGDIVQCCDATGHVTVNGHPLDEPYLHPGNAPSRIRFKVQVPRGRMFVLGDHRALSADSRYHLDDGHNGTVSLHLVVGRAFAIAWPTGHWRRLQEPRTFASVPGHAGTKTALGAPATADGGVTGARGPGPGGRTPVSGAREGPPVPAELPLVMTVVGLLPGRGRALSGRRTPTGARDEEHGREE
jgi:signal peptidase I